MLLNLLLEMSINLISLTKISKYLKYVKNQPQDFLIVKLWVNMLWTLLMMATAPLILMNTCLNIAQVNLHITTELQDAEEFEKYF